MEGGQRNLVLGAIAAILIGLHLAITALAAFLVKREGGTGDVSPSGRFA